MALCCLFLVSVSVTFPLTCINIIFSSVWVAEWPPFEKKLLTRLTICSLCVLTICKFIISRFSFEGWILVLIASVPGLGITFTFSILTSFSLLAITVRGYQISFDYYYFSFDFV